LKISTTPENSKKYLMIPGAPEISKNFIFHFAVLKIPQTPEKSYTLLKDL
jgi:hypothetical protein